MKRDLLGQKPPVISEHYSNSLDLLQRHGGLNIVVPGGEDVVHYVGYFLVGEAEVGHYAVVVFAVDFDRALQAVLYGGDGLLGLSCGVKTCSSMMT